MAYGGSVLGGMGSNGTSTNGPVLDSPPPRPRLPNKTLMNMSEDGIGGGNSIPDVGLDMSNPVVRAMDALGQIKQGFQRLGAVLPQITMPGQQIMSTLEPVVAQLVADLAAGDTPGTSGAALGAPGANMQPTAPPMSSGL